MRLTIISSAIVALSPEASAFLFRMPWIRIPLPYKVPANQATPCAVYQNNPHFAYCAGLGMNSAFDSNGGPQGCLWSLSFVPIIPLQWRFIIHLFLEINFVIPVVSWDLLGNEKWIKILFVAILWFSWSFSFASRLGRRMKLFACCLILRTKRKYGVGGMEYNLTSYWALESDCFFMHSILEVIANSIFCHT